jgi:hypothetical protein
MSRTILIPSPDPLTILVPVWGVLWGVFGTATLATSRPASTSGIPTWGVYAFFIGLAVSCSLVLIGMWLRSINGVRIKLGANAALGSLCLCYAVWSVTALGIVRSFVLVSFLMTICVASFWQAHRLNDVLRPKEE